MTVSNHFDQNNDNFSAKKTGKVVVLRFKGNPASMDYGNDGLDQHLKEGQSIDMIAHHKGNRIRSWTQDGHSLGRYMAAGKLNVYWSG
jgi:hypothetical protein